MFGRTLGGLCVLFGAGAANAQAPIVDILTPVPVQSAPASDTTAGYSIGNVPSRVPRGWSGKPGRRSAFRRRLRLLKFKLRLQPLRYYRRLE